MEFGIYGAKHRAHAAGADFRLDSILAELCSRPEIQCLRRFRSALPSQRESRLDFLADFGIRLSQ